MANVHISVREPASVLNPLAVDRYDIPSMFCVHSVKKQQRIVAIKESSSTDVETDRLFLEKLHLRISLVFLFLLNTTNARITVMQFASILKSLSVVRRYSSIKICVHSVKKQQRIVAIKASPSTDVETDRLLFEKLHLRTSLVHVVSAISSYNFMLADGRYLGLRDGKIFEVKE